MWMPFKQSLPARAWLAVSMITLLALISTLSSGFIAWISEHDAAAINLSGSLRMATYQICWKIAEGNRQQFIKTMGDELGERLQSIVIREDVQWHADSGTSLSYLALQHDWQTVLEPELQTGHLNQFLRSADLFVHKIDVFTSLLQRESEHMQQLQQHIQIVALLATLIILAVGLYQLETDVLSPLKEIVRATHLFRAGEHSVRVGYAAPDELGQMAAAFNAMADTIDLSHRNLEELIARKTRNLERANRILTHLNQCSRSVALGQGHLPELIRMIKEFESFWSGLQLTLFLQQSTDLCAEHLPTEETGINVSILPLNLTNHLRAYSIYGCNQVIGELRAYWPEQEILSWENELMQAFTDLVGTALSFERQRERDHHMLLLKERTTIARELHDSLAQSLSYMKLQVSRLQTLLERQESPVQFSEVVAELKDGVSNAYRHLRELLSTFRLQIKNGDFAQAMQETADEFAHKGEFRMALYMDEAPYPISASEQIHILQICREALSNCVRHAQAQQVAVHLHYRDDQVELSIDDDGIGVQEPFDQHQHHGIAIMHERASSLGGIFMIAPRESRGTRVHLVFVPTWHHGRQGVI